QHCAVSQLTFGVPACVDNVMADCDDASPICGTGTTCVLGKCRVNDDGEGCKQHSDCVHGLCDCIRDWDGGYRDRDASSPGPGKCLPNTNIEGELCVTGLFSDRTFRRECDQEGYVCVQPGGSPDSACQHTDCPDDDGRNKICSLKNGVKKFRGTRGARCHISD